ncbi:hypothetical protein Pelo_3599 [Pelomyxa schiedti]|nr:hypothetical protein Pelo_3599 [Pelomyxa schiedti]
MKCGPLFILLSSSPARSSPKRSAGCNNLFLELYLFSSSSWTGGPLSPSRKTTTQHIGIGSLYYHARSTLDTEDHCWPTTFVLLSSPSNKKILLSKFDLRNLSLFSAFFFFFFFTAPFSRPMGKTCFVFIACQGKRNREQNHDYERLNLMNTNRNY